MKREVSYSERIGRAVWNGLAAGPLCKLRDEDMTVDLFEDGHGAIVEGRELRILLRSPFAVFRRDRSEPAPLATKRALSRRGVMRQYSEMSNHSHAVEHYREHVRLLPVPDTVPVSVSVMVRRTPKPTPARKRLPEVIALGPESLWVLRDAFNKAALLSDAQRTRHQFEIVGGADGHSVEIKVAGLTYRLSSPHPHAFIRHDVFPEAWQLIPIDAPLMGAVALSGQG